MQRPPNHPISEHLTSVLDAEITSKAEQRLLWVRNGIPIISNVYLVKKSCQLVYLVSFIVIRLLGYVESSGGSRCVYIIQVCGRTMERETRYVKCALEEYNGRENEAEFITAIM
jgi:hypothetical protein